MRRSDDDISYEDEDGDETDDCPYCGASIYDDAEQCPACGQYLSQEDAPRRKPWWVIVGALVCLYVVYRWTF